MRKGFAAILIIGLIGAIIALAATFYLKQKQKLSSLNQSSVQSSPNPTPDETVYTGAGSANWKTYTYYNLSFKLPASWIVNTTGRVGSPSVFFLTPNADANETYVLKLTENFKAEDLFKDCEYACSEFETYTVNGNKYVKGMHRSDSDHRDHQYIAVQIGADVYEMALFPGTHQSYIDAILSTFKFVGESLLDVSITYNLPQGWRKWESPLSVLPSNGFLGLFAPDNYTAISVRREENSPGASLESYNGVDDVTKPIKIGGKEALNRFSCDHYSCNDIYEVLVENNIWHITFKNTEDCKTKACIDSSKYAKDRDTFLNSIKFK